MDGVGHTQNHHCDETIGDSDSNNDSEEEEEEGLQLLLGGLASRVMADTEWVEEVTDDIEGRQDEAENSGSNVSATSSMSEESTELHQAKDLSFGTKFEHEEELTPEFFHSAHSLTPDGSRLEKPPVQVVFDSTSPNRGNFLVTTRPIRRGQTLFTEKACVATPVHPYYQKDTDSAQGAVPACHCCWKSLATLRFNNNNELPQPQLWPVDTRTRVLCDDCGTLFCTNHCQSIFLETYGSCCLLKDCLCCVQEHEDEPDASLVVATRLFLASVHRYRSQKDDKPNITGQQAYSTVPPAAPSLMGPVWGMCGQPSDLVELEVGCAARQDDGSVTHMVEPLYQSLAEGMALTNDEQGEASAAFFATLVAICARNGVAVTTQSPFDIYYSALVRSAGGRSSDRHKAYTQQLANALEGDVATCADRGKLTRGMDQEIREQVVPKLAAVFPLTARINHSCDPSAQVESGTYVDCHLDVVAKRNLAKGEEVTISYIHLGNKSKAKRTRELRAKYLFSCGCSKCLGSIR